MTSISFVDNDNDNDNAMSDKLTAKCKVEWNGKFEAKSLENYMKWDHRILNRD